MFLQSVKIMNNVLLYYDATIMVNKAICVVYRSHMYKGGKPDVHKVK